MKHAIALIAALSVSGCMSIDNGGSVREYAQRAETHVGAPALNCMSACILLAVSDNGCVTPQHKLTFHGASNPTGGSTEEQWELWIASQYPHELRQWYLETGRHGVHTLSGAQAIAMGVNECV